jgi:hypothetical protein
MVCRSPETSLRLSGRRVTGSLACGAADIHPGSVPPPAGVLSTSAQRAHRCRLLRSCPGPTAASRVRRRADVAGAPHWLVPPGRVPDGAAGAPPRHRVNASRGSRRVDRPALGAHLRPTHATDPAATRPALAQVKKPVSAEYPGVTRRCAGRQPRGASASTAANQLMAVDSEPDGDTGLGGGSQDQPPCAAACPSSCPAGAPQLHIRGCVEIALAAADPDDQRGRTWHEYGCPAATSFFRPEAGGRRTRRLNRGWGVRTDPGLRRCSLWLIRAVSGSGWRMPVPCATTGTRSSVSKSSSRRASWTLNGSMTGG